MGIHRQFVEEAQALTPSLREKNVYPVRLVEIVEDRSKFQGWGVCPAGEISMLQEQSFGTGDSFILDFGDHYVGRLSFSVNPVGSPPDAPLKLKLEFGEMPCEIGEDFGNYDGWISSSWHQEETIYADILPAEIRLPRRYTFRYLKVTIVATSIKYRVSFRDIFCTTVTSADRSMVTPLPADLPEDLRSMDTIALKTLENCMQTVFEDGPKRDRRLWIGDLRLQALASYRSIRNDLLVKRCLYLFGGMTLEGGEVGACIFEQPHPHVDDTYFFDYSLFFTAILRDYYEATKDRDTLEILWPVALSQLQLALDKVDDRGILTEEAAERSFIDWHEELNKQAASQGVLIYCLKSGLDIAEELQLEAEVLYLTEQIDRLSCAAISEFYDEQLGLFVSGKNHQLSWASQVWMVLAGILGQENNRALLDRLFALSPKVSPNTPYMFHHLIEALFQAGQPERALEQMRSYWGSMLEKGADAFWEVYDPGNDFLSPYGSHLINSYCHAWSCTPTYFIRRYLAH